ncbi:hypothetical protein [Streptomyces sp. TRM68367]|uniref:hypothetical protein n=1 Tax=Streptomyces sp. TRM68367 TaxID=2758415 RepID=UPI002934A0C2|nr:hypothetical protein [Streptomyces sp. TRM68367]
MAAPAHLLLPTLSKPSAESSAEPDLAQACVLSAEGACAEAPLTSEPPLPDAAPLTSEPPLADAAPLTSESDAYADPSGLDSCPDFFPESGMDSSYPDLFRQDLYRPAP